MKKGESGVCMFFVMNGMLSSFQQVADEVDVIETFTEGAHFGEASFFSDEGFREVSVRADTHCSLEELSFKNLADLVSLYDDLAAHVEAFAAKHKVVVDAHTLKERAREIQEESALANDSSRRTSRHESAYSEPGSAKLTMGSGRRTPLANSRRIGKITPTVSSRRAQAPAKQMTAVGEAEPLRVNTSGNTTSKGRVMPLREAGTSRVLLPSLPRGDETGN